MGSHWPGPGGILPQASLCFSHSVQLKRHFLCMNEQPCLTLSIQSSSTQRALKRSPLSAPHPCLGSSAKASGRTATQSSLGKKALLFPTQGDSAKAFISADPFMQSRFLGEHFVTDDLVWRLPRASLCSMHSLLLGISGLPGKIGEGKGFN